MNLLIDSLPFEHNGLQINTDFRVSILFELLMQDHSITNKEKIILAIQLYFSENIEKALQNEEEAIDTILWFYSGGKNSTIKTKKEETKTETKIETKQIYSYEFDDDYIYSAFYQQYKIDLNDVKMHWWKFRALFKGLDDNVQFSKIMSYRAIDLSQIKDKDEKLKYKKLKKIYALPDMRTQEQKETEFAAAFW